MSAPLVTIVVPLHNGERHLRDALDSALAQTHSNTQIVVVDDGSTDASPAICDEYARRGVRTIRQPNLGISAARNAGLRIAEGSHVGFLDADDMWLPEKIDRHLAHLAANPRIGVSYSFSEFVDASGAPMGIYQTPKLDDVEPLDILCRTPIGNGSAGIFDRRVFDDIAFRAGDDDESIQYFDERIAESQDVECWMRIALTTDWDMAGIPEPLTRYRITDDSVSANLDRKLVAWERVLDRVSGYAGPQMAAWRGPAMGYHARHLARRAVTLRDGGRAVELFAQALRAHPRILVEEPQRTIMTGAAALSLRVLPDGLYEGLFDVATSVNDVRYRRRFPPTPASV